MVGVALLALGCPAPGGGGESASADSSTGTTDASMSQSSSSPPITTADESSGPSTATTSTADSSTTVAPTTSGTSESTGGEVCSIELPPSPGCPYEPAPGYAARSPRSPWAGGDDLTDRDDEQHGGFIQDPDGGVPIDCDIWAQDCPDGEKCMPWAADGGSSWNATHCTPIDPDPVGIGETCTVQGSGVSGIDDCDAGAMCWGVDNETNEGYCIEMCSCTEVNPVCNTPNTACVITNDGVLALCLGVCNPLDPMACDDGTGCFPVGDLFHCAPDASGAMGAPGDPCEYLNVCDPGSFCGSAGTVPGCDGSSGCCSSFCEIGDATGCAAGQECVPWYEAGAEPDACLGLVGACATP